ncbi:hypothetical protein [Streptomyces sp. ME19-01-6]|uniref:hypothetical protein n=1 Tax=Streptomyces sp. ME19-01-6 TaxID=3028686 RepID=UPI0029BBA0F2|nr:hypothetical protein [Streptomyces sp. ME19-01-6]MDX3230536.1 hypothetical protein [Streptomyces sp. ME19-01-6]
MATPTTPRRSIADLDVPAEQLAADIRFRTAMLLDSLQQAQPVTDGQLAEQRHFLDADPDTCVPLPGIPHPKTPGRTA